MDTWRFTVRLNADQAEVILSEKLCGKFGASLSDKREILLPSHKSKVLVFSKFYKRFASVFGLTVVLDDKTAYCDVTLNASCGKKGAPIVGDLGSSFDFCREARNILEPYII